MTSQDKPTGYQALMDQCRGQNAASKTVEEQLDALLSLHQKRQAQQEDSEASKQSVLDRLREQMRDELLPAFEELGAKYAAQGIMLELNADDFLCGGVGLQIKVGFDIHGMLLEGTVTPQGIGFQETRFSNNVRGVVQAGPMLRTRNLGAGEFREFLCERISQLVRSAMRSRPGRKPGGDTP
ncbi:MAG TPA: hypothetical protein VMY37_00060 [Thermoguttaceae bacterium]|nr:hypothetical protein [Thermoguttaceae bacterium]